MLPIKPKENSILDWYLAGFTCVKHYTTNYHFLDKKLGSSEQGLPLIFKNILATPAILPEKSRYLNIFLKTLKQSDPDNSFKYHTKKLMFDSGGFQVYRNKISLEEIYELNLKRYLKYNYADYYFMVDHPPTIEDAKETRLSKVKASIKYSLKLFDRLPPELQEKSISIFHCYNDDISEIELQLEGYRPILEASPWVAFSFAKPYMSLLEKAILLHSFLTNTRALSDIDLKFHILGLHYAPLIYFFNLLDIKSYDTSSPMTRSGFGKLLFSGQDIRAIGSLTEEQLATLKQKTGHSCQFCSDLSALQSDYSNLKYHNLLTFQEFHEQVENKEVCLTNFSSKGQILLNRLLESCNYTSAEQLQLF